MSRYRRLDATERAIMDKLNEYRQSISQTTVRRAHVGRLTITYTHRRPGDFMGRFGGGWNWKLGFQTNNETIMLSLLTFSVSLSRPSKTNQEVQP
jgi:hypothetical protein